MRLFIVKHEYWIDKLNRLYAWLILRLTDLSRKEAIICMFLLLMVGGGVG